MKQQRPPGTGTIEELPSGRHRARIWLADGVRHNFGPYDTAEEAQSVIDAIAVEAAESSVTPALGMTWAGWLERWQKDLQSSRAYVGMANVRSIVRKRLKVTPFADWPIRRVNQFTIRAWVKDLSKRTDIGFSSKQQTLLYARKACRAAVDAGALDSDPTEGVKVERGVVPTEEPWTYLSSEEQERAFSSDMLPVEWQCMVQFAAGTGLRAGEQWNLRLADLHVDGDPHVVVRYGSKRRAPKGRRIRRVPLFGLALDAARRWLKLLPAWCPKNPDGLAFPGERGGRQKVSRLPAEWRDWLASAGIDRRVRWHDLRHTCGSSLVSGWWGRAWSLQEVRDLLGHASIEETERYAHLGETALKKAAQGTSGPRAVQTMREPPQKAAVGYSPVTHPDQAQVSGKHRVHASSVDPAWTGAAELGDRLCAAVAAGDAVADELRVALACAVMRSELVGLATAAMGNGPHSLDRALDLAALVARLAGRSVTSAAAVDAS